MEKKVIRNNPVHCASVIVIISPCKGVVRFLYLWKCPALLSRLIMILRSVKTYLHVVHRQASHGFFCWTVLKMKIEMDKNMEKLNMSKQNVFGLD